MTDNRANLNEILETEKYYLSLLIREKEIIEKQIILLKETLDKGYDIDNDYKLIKLEQENIKLKSDIMSKEKYICKYLEMLK